MKALVQFQLKFQMIKYFLKNIVKVELCRRSMV